MILLDWAKSGRFLKKKFVKKQKYGVEKISKYQFCDQDYLKNKTLNNKWVCGIFSYLGYICFLKIYSLNIFSS